MGRYGKGLEVHNRFLAWTWKVLVRVRALIEVAQVPQYLRVEMLGLGGAQISVASGHPEATDLRSLSLQWWWAKVG